MSQLQDPVSGWHPDPYGRFPQRWWDGRQWTGQVRDHGGHTFADPGAATPHPGYASQPHDGGPVPGYWAPPVAPRSGSPGLAIASLVLGVGSLGFALIPFIGFFSVPFALCGLGLGIAGLVRAAKGYGGKGLSIAGICTATAALLMSVVYVFLIGATVDDSYSDINTDPSNGICNQDRFLQDPDC